MRTIKYKKSIGSTFTEETAFDLNVQEQRGSVIDIFVSGSTGVCTVKIKKVFTDSDGTEAVADISTLSPTAGTLLTQVFDYKVDHMRVTATCGTAEASQNIRITGTASK